MITSGTLAGLQEFLASWIAKDRSKHGHYFTSRVPKMAIYGAFISAPLGHVMISILQRLFAGRTSLRAKIMQIIVSNLIVRLEVGSQRTAFTNRQYTDLSYSERRLPHINGCDRRRSNFPPDPCDRPRGLHASDEGVLDYLSHRACFCSSIPSQRGVGSLLQLRRIRYRHLHQRAYQEEEAASAASQVPGWQDNGRKERLRSSTRTGRILDGREGGYRGFHHVGLDLSTTLDKRLKMRIRTRV